MIKDITIGQYLPGDSLIHKLDPRIKIILSFIFIVAVFIVNNFLGYCLIAIFTFSTIFISKVPFKYIFKGIFIN